MRTDSNSVLSLSSGVPPKKPISTKSPSKNGEAFSSDFNKAKDTLDAKKNTASDVDKASSSASAAPTYTTKKAENVISSNDEKGGGVATSDESPASTSHDTVTADGGKTLQPEGENAPSEEMLPAVSVDQTAALASASTVEVTADSLPVGVPEVGVDGVVDDKQVVATCENRYYLKLICRGDSFTFSFSKNQLNKGDDFILAIVEVASESGYAQAPRYVQGSKLDQNAPHFLMTNVSMNLKGLLEHSQVPS